MENVDVGAGPRMSAHARDRMAERNIEHEEVTSLLGGGRVRVLENGDGTRTLFRGALRVVYDADSDTVITAYRRAAYKKRVKKCRQAKNKARRREKRQRCWEEY